MVVDKIVKVNARTAQHFDAHFLHCLCSALAMLHRGKLPHRSILNNSAIAYYALHLLAKYMYSYIRALVRSSLS